VVETQIKTFRNMVITIAGFVREGFLQAPLFFRIAPRAL
jgi:hypothetical protein